jgi:hypothetical protein
MNSQETVQPDWRWGTPEGSREFDRLMDRRLTFREILEWLEEAETLSLRWHQDQIAVPPGGDGQRGNDPVP